MEDGGSISSGVPSKKLLCGGDIIGCSECITGCIVMDVDVGVEGGCTYLSMFSKIKYIRNCTCERETR